MMRTYTVEFVYDVTLDAENDEVAQHKAYRWLDALLSNPDKNLPDDVWSVRTVPVPRVVFVSGEKIGVDNE